MPSPSSNPWRKTKKRTPTLWLEQLPICLSTTQWHYNGSPPIVTSMGMKWLTSWQKKGPTSLRKTDLPPTTKQRPWSKQKLIPTGKKNIQPSIPKILFTSWTVENRYWYSGYVPNTIDWDITCSISSKSVKMISVPVELALKQQSTFFRYAPCLTTEGGRCGQNLYQRPRSSTAPCGTYSERLTLSLMLELPFDERKEEEEEEEEDYYYYHY